MRLSDKVPNLYDCECNFVSDKLKGSSSDICMDSIKSNEPNFLAKLEMASERFRHTDVRKSDEKVDRSYVFHAKSDDDMPGPETPGAQRLFPRLKRIQETGSVLEDKGGKSLLASSKKLKLLEEPTDLKKKIGEVSDTASKFEWLDPSRIKDANGRKPDNPLYDSTTLYIPPDALKKMSASQKQYWNVKCQYMDVVLFFKVVS